MKFIFGFDDFSPRNTNLGLLEQIKEHYPGFKTTLFLVPWESRFGSPTIITEDKFLPFCEALRKLDWIEVALHGLTHVPEEFLNISYDEAKKRILVAEKMLINRKIPYTKLFKAPFWQLSERGKDAAKDLGFVVAEDHYYNWNLKDDIPQTPTIHKGEDVMIAQGHIQNTMGNGLEEAMWKILKIPTDSTFGFLSEIFESEKIDPTKIDFRDPLKRVQITVDGKELK